MWTTPKPSPADASHARLCALPALILALAMGWSAPGSGAAALEEPGFHGLVVARATAEPLVGVEVRGRAARGLVRTNAEGRFRLDLEQEGGVFTLVANGYRRRTFELDTAHGSPGEAARFELDRLARLEVVIYDELDRPLPDARVVLRTGDPKRGEVGALTVPASEEWEVRTDASGRGRFIDLPADRELRATIHQSGRELREIRWPLELGAGEQLSVGWIVDRGRDRVGRLSSTDGTALAGVALWLVANDDGPFERRRPRHLSVDDRDLPLREIVTDERGRFEIPALAHGWYRLGPAPGGEHVPLAVALEHDLRDAPTRIELAAECGALITGVVRGSDGAGLANALVFAERAGVAGVLSARCDARGRFELHAAPHADLRLLARDQRFGFETRVVELPAGESEVVLSFE